MLSPPAPAHLLVSIQFLSIFIICCLLGYYSRAIPGTPTSGPLTNMTVKGGTSQACAACKYQRRKCAADCPLAPFFPPDQPKMFQNAHRLYGVSNILKIIKMLSPSQKVEAMKSIIFQSNMRERYPVYGCVGIIAHLQREIYEKQVELQAVNAQLSAYKQQQHQDQISSPPSQYSPSPQLQQLQLVEDDSKQVLALFNPQPFNSIPVVDKLQQNYQSDEVYDSIYMDNNKGNTWIDQQYNNNNLAIQPQSYFSQKQQQQPVENLQEYYDGFLDIDDRQSFIDSRDAYESCLSSESSLRDTKHLIEHVAENDLKDAAARFSLTSIN